MGNEIDKPCCGKESMKAVIEQQSNNNMEKKGQGKGKKGIRNMVSTQQSMSQERRMTEFTAFKNKLSRENIYDIFRFGKVLGNGKFGIVRIAQPKHDDSLTFAIKSISRKAFKED